MSSCLSFWIEYPFGESCVCLSCCGAYCLLGAQTGQRLQWTIGDGKNTIKCFSFAFDLPWENIWLAKWGILCLPAIYMVNLLMIALPDFIFFSKPDIAFLFWKDLESKKRILQKKYWALVIGCPRRSGGIISAPLGKVRDSDVSINLTETIYLVSTPNFVGIGYMSFPFSF